MLFLPAILATAAFAAPLQKRAFSSNDQSVLDLALYLEHLEFALYTGGCNNFTDDDYTAAGFPSGFRENVCVIASHEAAHAAAISSILEANGAPIIPACSYSFPYTDPTTFVDLANMITSVGIGAYVGGSEAGLRSPFSRSLPSMLIAETAPHRQRDTRRSLGQHLDG